MIKMVTNFVDGIELEDIPKILRNIGGFGGESEIIVDEFLYECIIARKIYDMYVDEGGIIEFRIWLEKKVKKVEIY